MDMYSYLYIDDNCTWYTGQHINRKMQEFVLYLSLIYFFFLEGGGGQLKTVLKKNQSVSSIVMS